MPVGHCPSEKQGGRSSCEAVRQIRATNNTLTWLNMMIPIRKRHGPQPTFVARSLASTTQKVYCMAFVRIVFLPQALAEEFRGINYPQP
ncbi:hypothetical protein PGT21_026177 [Puccinia graminis f. sp. tritici]|uniref:Uncharacterized protein n=1 Tax=Puccinia graminis f. sp. tritici TaxID=56615 RepID=A0A5B0MVA1_PUCGR|nr:hypothetical protein PGT21_026177 [Puccinia graminis f. sp. tritici]KAA1131109.1 hypothetical protein PGTUg99_008914 [Puccinia graminis f. sp. tritici]